MDDDEDVLEDMCDTLTTAGHNVTGCPSGFAAVEAAAARSFDLVVADIRMPGMDGLAALEKVRTLLPHMRSIVVTGYTAEADSVRAVRLGVGDYLRKPFRAKELLDAVARQREICLAEKRRAGRENQLRRAALWAMETLSQEVCPDQDQLAHSRLAYRTAQELGLPTEAAEEIQQAVLARALPERISRAGLPPPVQRLLADLAQSEDAPSLGVRIARAVAGEGEETPGVQEALAKARRSATAPARADQDDAGKRRGLFYLAQTLESSQPSAAQKAYETLALQSGTAEAVDAELGLLRLHRAHPDVALGHLEKAVQAARARNPMTLASTALEAGSFLLELGRARESYAYFQESHRLAGEFALPCVAAGAYLGTLAAPARLPLEPPALAGALQAFEELLKPENRSDLLRLARWLLPWTVQLAAQSPGPQPRQTLAYLARECPGEFEPWLTAARPEGERVVATEALAHSAHPKAEEYLQTLAADSLASVRQAAERGLSRTSAPQLPLLRIYTLGRFAVMRGEETIIEKALPSQRGRFLLAWLAATPGPIPVERVMDEFWPEEGDAGRNNFNSLVSSLRKTLRPAGWPDSLDYLQRTGTNLALNRSLPIWGDAQAFLTAASQNGLDAWRQAIQLYRGPYLETCYMDWAVTMRERLEAAARQCLGKLLEALLEGQRFQEVVDQGARMLELDPCCQTTQAQIIQALIALKRPEAAIRQFEIAQKSLRREMGLEPSIALLELYQRARLSLA